MLTFWYVYIVAHDKFWHPMIDPTKRPEVVEQNEEAARDGRESPLPGPRPSYAQFSARKPIYCPMLGGCQSARLRPAAER